MQKQSSSTREIWRDIKDYEGLYQVSSLGRVKKMSDGRILKQSLDTAGYMHLGLTKDKKTRTFNTHRLVVEAFQEVCGSIFPNWCVNHKDCDRTNNSIENLEVCTYQENNTYKPTLDKLRNRPEVSSKVDQFSMDGVFIASFPSMREAERQTGIDHSGISKCCKGLNDYAGNYTWRYA